MKHRIMNLFICFLFILIAIVPGSHVPSGETTVQGDDLHMTILDDQGIKRLLCRDRPTMLTQGIFFTFPDGAEGCEICVNGGTWTKVPEENGYPVNVGELAYGETLDVRFRAWDEDRGLLYSRSYVLIRVRPDGGG